MKTFVESYNLFWKSELVLLIIFIGDLYAKPIQKWLTSTDNQELQDDLWPKNVNIYITLGYANAKITTFYEQIINMRPENIISLKG